jgi:hypothetical protein
MAIFCQNWTRLAGSMGDPIDHIQRLLTVAPRERESAIDPKSSLSLNAVIEGPLSGQLNHEHLFDRVNFEE